MSNTVEEARRYVNNAKEILSEKARKEDGYYQDTKYVKLAGHAAYTGVLVALDGLFGKKGKGRKDVDWYKERLSTMDKKLLYTFVAAYDTLHLSMSYDGNPAAEIAVAGLKMAESIIAWVETRSATA
ncbi:hypothetical protein FEM33_23025 [Dyadobacter flavalbus]|uniref:DUF5618 domain-containing protein n=1 Tax=Dyadobacter flavalbus TaxID=2579942 RepID=A0A5M8QHB8_9BACT|nr:DUF5618 family protein [Dyadobacter flavalbus]KAA6434156.1 hypothetical protein FEM33_23025 [Dyadobacter flavalbus]